VVGLAAGGSKKSNGDEDDSGNLVVATSENDLTFMTGNKAEKYVMGLDGEFVTMAAGEDWVFFVHRPGATTIDGWSFGQELRMSRAECV
jgi:chromosome transmission fidelity protein 4